MSEPLIRAAGLRKSFKTGDGEIEVLSGIDLTLEVGETVSIVGTSGVGKSTLLHIRGALDRPDAGRVLLDGRDLAGEKRLDRVRAHSIGFIFQLHNLLPALSAVENVELPLYALRVPAAERRRRALARLADVGLADRARHRPDRQLGLVRRAELPNHQDVERAPQRLGHLRRHDHAPPRQSEDHGILQPAVPEPLRKLPSGVLAVLEHGKRALRD